MVYTCQKCGKAFAHASSLSRHRKVCGRGAPHLPCPHCTATFSRADDQKRHIERYCKKGNKRPAVHTLPENVKHLLVDYSSSEEEEMPEQESVEGRPATPPHVAEEVISSHTHPLHIEPWRVAAESSSDEEVHSCVESDEEEQTIPLPPRTESDEEEPVEEVCEPIEEGKAAKETLSLDTLKKALPWAEYQGVGEEQFSTATQQMGGNPLFQFDFLPVSSKQWMKRVEKTVYRTKLRQRRLPLKTDDVGVAIVNAMEASTRQHLEKIRAREEDRVFLAITAHDFNHLPNHGIHRPGIQGGEHPVGPVDEKVGREVKL